MSFTKEQLKEILQEDFINNPDAFTAGRRNDDVVDSMCICHALNEEWTEMYAKHADNFADHDQDYFNKHVKEHYERVKEWLDDKAVRGYEPGYIDIMCYAINY